MSRKTFVSMVPQFASIMTVPSLRSWIGSSLGTRSLSRTLYSLSTVAYTAYTSQHSYPTKNSTGTNCTTPAGQGVMLCARKLHERTNPSGRLHARMKGTLVTDHNKKVRCMVCGASAVLFWERMLWDGDVIASSLQAQLPAQDDHEDTIPALHFHKKILNNS